MPDPNKFKDEDSWMSACMRKVKEEEGKPQDQAVAQCLSMWRNRKKKACVSAPLKKLASALALEAIKAKDSKWPVLFLGGECKDGKWQKEIEREYGKKFFILNPYDKKWEAEDNIYDELAGIVNADYVVFLKGGEGTKKEKSFMDLIGRGKDYKSFETVDSLKRYLGEVGSSKKSFQEEREAFPVIHEMDLRFEQMSKKEREEVLKDILSEDFQAGRLSIKVPQGGMGEQLKMLTIKDISPEIMKYIQMYVGKPVDPKRTKVEYDEGKHEYVVKNAKLGGTYELASTQVDFPEDIAQRVIAWSTQNIPDDELYEDPDKSNYGREDEIHVTLLYGLKTDEASEVGKYLNGASPFKVRLGTVTAFRDSKDYDVLKIDIDCPEMFRMHYMLEKNLPNDNSYPTYHPHCTIAYLKKGFADKYIGNQDFSGISFVASKIVYSSKDGQKTELPIGASDD